MKPSEVLGIQTDEKDRVVAIMGSRQLIEQVRNQYPGARVIIRKPVMVNLMPPEIPDAPRRLATSEKVTKQLREWKINDAGFGITSIAGITVEGETISDYLLKPFVGTEELAEGERAIYGFGE